MSINRSVEEASAALLAAERRLHTVEKEWADLQAAYMAKDRERGELIALVARAHDDLSAAIHAAAELALGLDTVDRIEAL